jgi:protein-tyrosine phosphatase
MSRASVAPRKPRIRPPTLQVANSVVEQEASTTAQLFEVSPNLCISGYEAAKSFSLLRSSSITHVLNLAGEAKCPNAFPSSFQYCSLKMPDNPKIDILFFIYSALKFIIESIKQQGKVLMHCVKGTSRAATIAIAYLMMQGCSEQEAFNTLHGVQPNIDPNFGFVCQLKEFKAVKEELRVYYYLEKHEMFANLGDKDGCRIEINGKTCVGYLQSQGERKQQAAAEECIRMWEQFNQAQASIVYI